MGVIAEMHGSVITLGKTDYTNIDPLVRVKVPRVITDLRNAHGGPHRVRKGSFSSCDVGGIAIFCIRLAEDQYLFFAQMHVT